jgi:cobyrinic acid a,c-diamide synthase
VLRDSAFQFYYPENLEAFSRNGAQLVELSALAQQTLPELDGLYIGGGFPETHAERLAENNIFKESLQSAVQKGLPVYAECGGLMYLSRSLRIDQKIYPMVGVFPVDTVLERKPQGHGYIRVEVSGPNPFYPVGSMLTGHEFHYSYVTGVDDPAATYAFRILRGHGMDGSHDGICIYNALGTYVHVHALGEPLWIEGILKRAREYRSTAGLADREEQQADRVQKQRTG